MKKQMKLVLLAVLLVLMVCLTVTLASAADVADAEAFKNAVAAGGEVNLTADITLTEGITIDKDVTIKGNGHKITFTGATNINGDGSAVIMRGSYAVITYAFNLSAGNIAISDVTVAAPNDDAGKTAVFYVSGTSATTLTDIVTDGGFMVVVYNAAGSVTVTGKSNLGGNCGNNYVLAGSTAAADASFSITGGTISHTTDGALRSGGDMLAFAGFVNFTATNTTFASAGDSLYFPGGVKLLMTNCTTTSNGGNGIAISANDKNDVTIDGGSYTAAAGKRVIDFNKGKGLIKGNPTMKGLMSTMIADVVIESGTFESDAANAYFMNVNEAYGKLTINGGSFKFTGTADANYLIRISDPGASVFINGGNFTMNGKGQLILKNNGALTITAGSFTQNGADAMLYIGGSKGEINISGGTFRGGSAWIKMYAAAIVNISGNPTFSGLTGGRAIWIGNPSYDDGAYTSEKAKGQVNISGGTFTVEANSGASIFVNGAGADINVSGGEFVCEKDIPIFAIQDKDCVSTLTISGGVFTSKNNVVNITAGQRTDRPQGELTITGGTMYVGDGKYGINITHEGQSGVVNIENVTIKCADPAGYCVPVVVGNANVTLNIKGGSFDSNHSGSAIWINAAKAVNITGGTFEGYRTMNVYKCDAVTISGGTFKHNVQDDSGEDQATSVGIHLREEGAMVTITGGTFTGKGDGVTVAEGTAVIQGGEFTVSGESASAVVVGNGFAAISNGTFTVNDGGSALHTSGTGTLNVFGGTFDGNGIKLYMSSAATVNLSEITFAATTTYNNTIHLSNASRGGTLNIESGTYYGGTANVINAAGAEIIVTGGTFEGAKNVFAIGDNDVTSVVTIMGGEFKLTGNGAIFSVDQRAGERAETGDIQGSIAINGGTYDAGTGKFLAVNFGKLISLSINVGDVTVTGAGDALIYISAASNKAAIAFNGGTYTLTSEDGVLVKLANGSYYYAKSEDSFKDEEGNVTNQEALDAWLELFNKYGETFECAAQVTFNGSTLLDKSAAGEAVIDMTDVKTAPVLKDCTILCKTLKAYFVATGDAKTAAPMSNAVPTVAYGEENYYTWHKLAATDATLAPSLVKGASVRVTVGSQGIRFTTRLSAVTVAKLEALGTVTYGTLIAPADVVLKAGAFTIEALTAYATEHFEGDTTKVFANIVATNSLQNDIVAGVSFNGVLTNVKESNYNRGMAAVGYACVNGTYYYSAYDCTANARTMSDIAAAAIADVVEEATGDYIHLVDGMYSRYTQEQIDALKVYLPAA